MKWFLRVFGIILIISGIALILRISGIFSPEKVAVAGTVTGSTAIKTGAREGSFAPVLKFKTKEGKDIETTDETSDMGSYQKGQHVNVLYNANNPQDARINSFAPFSTYTLGLSSLIIIGILFLLGARSVERPKIRYGRRHKRTAPARR